MDLSAPPVLCDIDAVDLVGDRSEQQDAYGVRNFADGSVVVALADGMGGHVGGRVASRTAVETFLAVCGEPGAPDDGATFDAALAAANAALAREAAKDPALAGMGTTLVALRISRNGLSWISVGDSPLWLWRDSVLLRLNEDHSLREIARDRAGRQSSALCSALTGTEIALVDRRPAPIELKSGDLLVLASDGVLTIDEPALSALLGTDVARPPHAIADEIVAALVGIAKMGQDNMTLVLARVREATAPPPAIVQGRSLSPIGPLLFGLLWAIAAAGATISLWPRHG